MDWTEQKPTQPGWYWHWYDGCDEPYILEIIWADKEGGPLVIWNDLELGPLERAVGWFMGPLERPERPVKGHE